MRHQLTVRTRRSNVDNEVDIEESLLHNLEELRTIQSKSDTEHKELLRDMILKSYSYLGHKSNPKKRGLLPHIPYAQERKASCLEYLKESYNKKTRRCDGQLIKKELKELRERDPHINFPPNNAYDTVRLRNEMINMEMEFSKLNLSDIRELEEARIEYLRQKDMIKINTTSKVITIMDARIITPGIMSIKQQINHPCCALVSSSYSNNNDLGSCCVIDLFGRIVISETPLSLSRDFSLMKQKYFSFWKENDYQDLCDNLFDYQQDYSQILPDVCMRASERCHSIAEDVRSQQQVTESYVLIILIFGGGIL